VVMPPLLFDHFPKAGGTTIRRYLLRCFHPDDTFNLSPFKLGCSRVDFASLPSHEHRRFKCVLAHGGRALRTWMPLDTAVITTVREPVSRTISWYFYARGIEQVDEHHDAVAMDAVEFVRKYNLGTFMLSYFGSLDAMKNDYEIIGDQSRLDVFGAALQERFSLGKRYENAVSNKGQSKTLSPAQLKEVERLCEPDTRMYEGFRRAAGPSLTLVKGKRCAKC